MLIAAEMLEAVGAAILVPSSLALVLQTFPREKIPQRSRCGVRLAQWLVRSGRPWALWWFRI